MSFLAFLAGSDSGKPAVVGDVQVLDS